MNSRGFTLLNVIISIGILTTLLLAINQTLHWTARTHRDAQNRMQAAWRAHGLLESIKSGEYRLQNLKDNKIIIPIQDAGFSGTTSISAQDGPNDNLWEVNVAVEWTSLSGKKNSTELRELMVAPKDIR